MEITEIKQKLDIIGLAEGFGIKVDKNGKALCPFHNDGSPSLQFSKPKQICTCFSSNCAAGTMDLIGLTERYLQVSTHEALKYLAKLAGEESKANGKKPKANTLPSERDYAKDFAQMQSSYLSSSIARKYTESRGLSRQLQCFGYNAYKDSRFDYLKGCITFGLRDESGKVVSLYGRSVKANDRNVGPSNKHYYTPNRQGLFPSYPRAKSTKVILTESVIDAATLLSMLEITKDYEILALYGTNGLTAEHINALQKLTSLAELIFFFDGDEAGRAAIQKQGEYLKSLFPKVKLSSINTAENEDVNSLFVGHEPALSLQLLKERTELLFSQELAVEEVEIPPKPNLKSNYQLESMNPNNLILQTEVANYYIKGGLRKDLDSLKVTLVIEHPINQKKSRNKLDLYEDRQSTKTCRDAAEKLDLRADLLERDVSLLTDLLDEYRESYQKESAEESKQSSIIPLATKKECLAFLSKPNLLSRINELIGESGVVGEENNRIFLFGIASSYKMEDTLHALIQGSSGSGKTHLLASILSMMPQEDVISLTRVTESSFYNYGEYDLSHKIIGLEDYDGLEEKAELAFRELQSKGMISSSTSMKDEQTGKISAQVKVVYGPIASLSATTRGEIYEDNMSRCFLVAVDESQQQTLRIIKEQNRAAAGHVDRNRSKEIKAFLQNCIRLLQSYEVINPYADQIDLPKEAHKIRRLNSLFQCYVRQITLINQYQRKKDSKGRLISDKEDIREAIKIMFESILLKVDELDGSLRGFYDRLKGYVKQKGNEYEFSLREIRQEFRVSKTQMHRYTHQLLELEYISKSYVSSRNTYHYKIAFWDHMKALRERISKDLNEQLDQIKERN